MSRRVLVAYSSSIVALGATAAYQWRDAASAGRDDDFSIPPAPAASAASGERSDSAFAELEQLIAANDPFRLSNAPSTVAYDPANDGIPGAIVAQQPVRPTFALKAIVGGPPWQAIIDGIPGQPSGTVVAGGMAFGKLTIRSVARDSVVIQGSDTTWVLAFRGRS
jgi:hypothetical protein